MRDSVPSSCCEDFQHPTPDCGKLNIDRSPRSQDLWFAADLGSKSSTCNRAVPTRAALRHIADLLLSAVTLLLVSGFFLAVMSMFAP